jgi:hypothetical protein
MAQLLTLAEVHENAYWYFSDAEYNPGNSRFSYKWPSANFPYHKHIHHTEFDGNLRVEIRRWMNRCAAGDVVIVDSVDNKYHKYYEGSQRRYEDSYNISNTWFRFSFEDENTALMFSLAFSEKVRPMTLHHPKHPEDEAWCKMTPRERLGITD